MSFESIKRFWKGSRAFRDLIVIAAIAFVMVVLAVIFNTFEAVVACVVLLVAVVIYSLRRRREFTYEIMEREWAMEKLREGEELLRTVINSTKEAMISVGEDGLIVLFNTAAEEMFGRKRGEMLRQPLDCLMPKEYRKRYRQYVESYFATGKPDGAIGKVLELPGLRSDGSVFAMEISLSAGRLEDKQFVIAVARDITERKRAEEVLQESEKRFRSTLDNMLEGCQIIGRDWRYLYVNDVVATQGRRYKEELIGHKMMEMYPGIEETAMFAVLRQCMENRTVHRMENEFTFHDGSKGWFELSIQPIPEGIFILSLDITQRKRVEDALRKSEERFKQVAENAQEWIWEVDTDGLYTYSSPVVEKILGYKAEDIVGQKHFYEFIHPDRREELKKSAFEVFSKKQSFREFLNLNVNKDGRLVLLSTSGVPVLDDEGNLVGYRGADTDVTESKKAERKIVRLNKILRMVMSINEDMFLIRDRRELLQRICEKIVEYEYRMVWIGFCDEKMKRIIPEAQAGFEEGYLSSIRVTYDDTEYGRGPTGMAIKTKKPSVMRFTATDPEYEPWRQQALKRGYRSSAALPIFSGDTVIGALSVYARRDDAFGSDEVNLLERLAHDIAIGLRGIEEEIGNKK